MKRIRVSRPAKKDLDDIWYWVASQSGNMPAAERVVGAITKALALLASPPEGGRSREEIEPGLRSFPVGNYVIYYGVEGSAVVVKRILHGMREQRRAYFYSSPPPR